MRCLVCQRIRGRTPADLDMSAVPLVKLVESEGHEAVLVRPEGPAIGFWDYLAEAVKLLPSCEAVCLEPEWNDCGESYAAIVQNMALATWKHIWYTFEKPVGTTHFVEYHETFGPPFPKKAEDPKRVRRMEEME